jgi:hypothetical protein
MSLDMFRCMISFHPDEKQKMPPNSFFILSIIRETKYNETLLTNFSSSHVLAFRTLRFIHLILSFIHSIEVGVGYHSEKSLRVGKEREPPIRFKGKIRNKGRPTMLDWSKGPHTRESTDTELQSPMTNT